MPGDNPKLSELEGEEREQTLAYVAARWSQFASTLRDARKDAAKFIAVINAGGAGAVLAFMGALLKDRQDIAQALPLRLALLSFLLGVGSCGIAHAAQNVRISGLFAQWRKDALRFFEDKIGFKQLREDDVKRADEFDHAGLFIWAALLFFGFGAGVGVFLLF